MKRLKKKQKKKLNKMTESLTTESPSRICFNQLVKRIGTAKRETPEQRQIVFENLFNEIQWNRQFLISFMNLLTDLLYDREFHKRVSLPYRGPNQENRAIISSALMRAFVETKMYCARCEKNTPPYERVCIYL